MKWFSSTAFGSLHLAFKLDKVPSDFVGSLLCSPSAGRFVRLHFHVVNRKRNGRVYEKLIEAIEMKTERIRLRPWCENLLPFIEEEDHPDVVKSTSELVFVKDRYPKVKKKDYFPDIDKLGKCSFFMFTKKKN